MKLTALWGLQAFSVVEVDRRFRGAYCLHYQGSTHLWNVCLLQWYYPEGKLAAVRTWNVTKVEQIVFISKLNRCVALDL
jgi:hypothetical protein